MCIRDRDVALERAYNIKLPVRFDDILLDDDVMERFVGDNIDDITNRYQRAMDHNDVDTALKVVTTATEQAFMTSACDVEGNRVHLTPGYCGRCKAAEPTLTNRMPRVSRGAAMVILNRAQTYPPQS